MWNSDSRLPSPTLARTGARPEPLEQGDEMNLEPVPWVSKVEHSPPGVTLDSEKDCLP